MNAYSESYLSDAQRRLGSMLDIAVNGFDVSLGSFYRLFLESALSLRFAAGEPSIVAGRSGEELALEVIGQSNLDNRREESGADGPLPSPPKPLDWQPAISASREYWTGWALAFYQWASNQTFQRIQQHVDIAAIHLMYSPYHEMDIRQFCEEMDRLIDLSQPQTNLQVRRLQAGLSQRQLAHAAGIPFRTLQQYEQRQKDINHARADYLVALARALSCSVEDLLEHRTDESIYRYAVITLDG